MEEGRIPRWPLGTTEEGSLVSWCLGKYVRLNKINIRYRQHDTHLSKTASWFVLLELWVFVVEVFCESLATQERQY